MSEAQNVPTFLLQLQVATLRISAFNSLSLLFNKLIASLFLNNFEIEMPNFS